MTAVIADGSPLRSPVRQMSQPLLTRRPIDLAPSLVYGPIASRRFGRSLGINLVPEGLRLCQFDCVYCQCDGARTRLRAPSHWQ